MSVKPCVTGMTAGRSFLGLHRGQLHIGIGQSTEKKHIASKWQPNEKRPLVGAPSLFLRASG